MYNSSDDAALRVVERSAPTFPPLYIGSACCVASRKERRELRLYTGRCDWCDWLAVLCFLLFCFISCMFFKCFILRILYIPAAAVFQAKKMKICAFVLATGLLTGGGFPCCFFVSCDDPAAVVLLQ